MNEHQVKIRLSADTKAWLKAEADRNRRSMNAEIVTRLEASREIQDQAAAGGHRHD